MKALSITPLSAVHVIIQQLQLLKLKGGPLATVSSLPILHSAQWYFTVWLAECLVAGLFGIAFPLLPLPLCILVVGGCYSLACLQSSWLILFASCFFIPLFQWLLLLILLLLLFYFSLFDRLPLNVFQCDWCPCMCCLVLFCLSLHWGVGPNGWVVDTAGNEGGSILQGLRCWSTVRLFWAPDLHLQQMLLTYITK